MTEDWNPGAYARFRALRLRPALDLLMQAGALPQGDLVDLGCGDGAAAESLRSRYPKRRLIGVDSSPAMLAKARGYDKTCEADIAAWEPAQPPALIFSNAALHWLPDHERLLPRLAGLLAPGGVLAVQMPRQFGGASHSLIRQVAADMFPERFDFSAFVPPVAAPEAYHRLLAPLGQLNLWETEYLQVLEPVEEGHPVRAFTASTAMRPVSERLTTAELQRFLAAYDAALAEAYPPERGGTVLFPFRRLFFVLSRPR
ncbi:methyltransferase domain-containing protein [Pseudoroseicyclus sp. H15]